MMSEISIYTCRDFAGQFEAVLHNSQIHQFTVRPPTNSETSERRMDYDLILNFRTEKEPDMLKESLCKALGKLNISRGLYRIQGLELTENEGRKETGTPFSPINFGNRFRIVGESMTSEEKPSENIIAIDPGDDASEERHVAISLSLTVIEEFVGKCKKFLDFGTGSGVLSIAAIKLGAEKVDAVVTSPLMASTALRNIERNNCRGKVSICSGSYDSIPHNDYQAALVNADIDSLSKGFDKITKTMTKAKYFILSGIPQAQCRDVNSFLAERSIVPSLFVQKREWCVYLLRTGAPW